MDLQPRGHDKVTRLLEQGVTIPNPLTLDIGDEVDVTRISGDGVVIYPGCRIYGSRTAISSGVKLGAEGPVTVDDCWLGPDVELRGGYFRHSVFLEKARAGSCAQVREGCLLEEQASIAHCVGLKQSILFPFVTLGSLVNLCDCLVAGGTSREDHSEVGSSYVHFNFTPDGDKATASMFGDVPRGVMLDRSPIFLGGQGGAVGPVRVSYGAVVAAGSILRHDVLEDNRLVVAESPPGFERGHLPRSYRNLARVLRNNILYLANLVALEEWYRKVRSLFFAHQPQGELVCQGALEVLSLAKSERIRCLRLMVEKVPEASTPAPRVADEVAGVCALFEDHVAPTPGEGFVAGIESMVAASPEGYVDAIKGLAPDVAASGVEWLQEIVDALSARADELLPDLRLFDAGR